MIWSPDTKNNTINSILTKLDGRVSIKYYTSVMHSDYFASGLKSKITPCKHCGFTNTTVSYSPETCGSFHPYILPHVQLPYLRGITVLRPIHSLLSVCSIRRGTAGSRSRAMLAVRASAYGIRSLGESSVKCSRIRISLGLLDGNFWKAGGET